MEYVLLAGGIAILFYCGESLVRGSVAIAQKIGIPSFIIGLTIVGFGTSAPELVVSLRAALDDAPGIAIGNVVGSNIVNVLLVLGLSALFRAVDCDEPLILRNTLYAIGATVVFNWMCVVEPLSFLDGSILFALLIVFLIESSRRVGNRVDRAALAHHEMDDFMDRASTASGAMWKAGLLLAVGLIGLPLGAHLTVDSASEIALAMGISQATVGLSVVALGTSLPELATTIAAARHSHSGLAIGNVVGSNLFNILGIMGVTAIIVPVQIPDSIKHTDLWVMLAAILALAPFVFWRMKIGILVGATFVVGYFLYVFFLFMPRFLPLG